MRLHYEHCQFGVAMLLCDLSSQYSVHVVAHQWGNSVFAKRRIKTFKLGEKVIIMHNILASLMLQCETPSYDIVCVKDEISPLGSNSHDHEEKIQLNL